MERETGFEPATLCLGRSGTGRRRGAASTRCSHLHVAHYNATGHTAHSNWTHPTDGRPRRGEPQPRCTADRCLEASTSSTSGPREYCRPTTFPLMLPTHPIRSVIRAPRSQIFVFRASLVLALCSNSRAGARPCGRYSGSGEGYPDLTDSARRSRLSSPRPHRATVLGARDWCTGVGVRGNIMCLDCGCGRPEDSRGDERHITLARLRSAAEASGVSVRDALRNMDKTARRALSEGAGTPGTRVQLQHDLRLSHSPNELLSETLAEEEAQPR